MSGELFKRNWAVYIGPQGETGVKYEKLRITFDIEKTSDSAPNKAKIEITNMSSASIQTFSKKGLLIRLDAGYVNNLQTIYIGDVAKPSSKRSGDQVLTTFECGDGEKVLSSAHFSNSYPAGTTYVKILQDICLSLGVTIGPVLGIQQQVFNQGVVFAGSSKRAIDRLTFNQGLEWSIQDGVLQILPKTAHTGDEAVYLSQDTGLIGIPTKKDDGVEFISLMNPKLAPGVPVQIVSNTINGFFKIRKAKYEGDSHGDKWQVSCECVPIKAQQKLTVSVGTNFVAGNSA